MLSYMYKMTMFVPRVKASCSFNEVMNIFNFFVENSIYAFADKLKKASIMTIEDGVLTGDLAALSDIEGKHIANTEAFLQTINERLVKLL